MCLLGFDIEAPEGDFVGFAIECKAPGASTFQPLFNRMAFSYDEAVSEVVNVDRNFPSTAAPFKKFRCIHFSWDVQKGLYTYRATKMHMRVDNQLKKGLRLHSISLSIR